MFRVGRYSAATAALCCCAFTHSIAAGETSEEVVVTATRVEQPVSEVIGSVTVLTRADIERRQPQSLQDLLRGEAGISLDNAGGLGKTSQLYVRGTDSDHTLILIDGVRVGSATTGTTPIEYFSIDQIERIEIVRGPRSSLYGSGAIGGVIQIFTRKAQGVGARVGAGSHKTQDYGASFGDHAGDLRFSAAGNYIQSDGFNACNGTPTAGCFAIEPDSDGFRNSSASVHLGYEFGALADLAFNTLYARGYTEYDGYDNQTRFRQSAPSARLRVQPLDSLTFTVTGGITQDDSDIYYDAQFHGRFNTERRNASLQTDWNMSADQVITVGADYLDDRVDSDTAYERTSRDNTGVFAQYQGRFGDHEWLGAVREDDNEQFGAHHTGNAGWKWFVADRALAVNAGWGSAFRAPNFNDLYYPGFSNPLLRPERSQSYELGLSGDLDWLSWSVQGFLTRAEDLIALDGNYVPQNVSEARLRGAELMLRGEWDQFSAALNYTALDPRSREAGANYNHILQRRARHSGRVDLSYRLGKLQLGSLINIAGARYDNLANTVRMGGYATVDVLADWSIARGWSLQAKLSNAFDREYELVRHYNQDGRAVFVSVRYSSGEK